MAINLKSDYVRGLGPMLLFKSHLKLPLIDTFSTECLVSFREWARDKISKCRGSSQTVRYSQSI